MWRGIVGLLAVLVIFLPELAFAGTGNDDPLSINSFATWIEWWETNRDTYLSKTRCFTGKSCRDPVEL